MMCFKLKDKSYKLILTLFRFEALSLICNDILGVSEVDEFIIESGSPLYLNTVALNDESLFNLVVISLPSLSNMSNFVLIIFVLNEFDNS